jgi:hypothetical protein
MKFTEAQLEVAITELLGAEGYPHVADGAGRQPQEGLALRSQVVSKPYKFTSNTRAH